MQIGCDGLNSLQLYTAPKHKDHRREFIPGKAHYWNHPDPTTLMLQLYLKLQNCSTKHYYNLGQGNFCMEHTILSLSSPEPG